MTSSKAHIINKCFLAVLLLAFLSSSCSEKEQSKTLRLAHGLDVNHSVHIAMVKMGEELDRLSKGKLTIQIYPNQQLGSERELLELVQLGSIDMTKSSAAVVESFSPEYKVFGIPYLFTTDEHRLKVLNGEIGQRILNSSTDYNLRGLSYYDSGKRSFYTKDRLVEKPSDLKGLKIRVQQSNTAIQMVNSYEASATPIAFGELYSALQQGVVDGAENNPPSFYLTRHYEVCSYYILNEHTAIPDILVISEITWKELNEQERAWVREAADVSRELQFELWEISEQESLDAVKAAGVQVIYPDKEPFKQASQELIERLTEDPLVRELYLQIQDLE